MNAIANNITVENGTALFKDLTALMMGTEATPLVLGNVEFWIDLSGPWAGQLAFSIPTSKWDAQAIGQSVAQLCRVYPEVTRIYLRYFG